MVDHPHGHRGRYRAGCRCDQCKLAENDYRKVLRQSNRGAKLHAVPPIAGGADERDERETGGSVRDAVAREIAQLAGTDDKPGQVAVALQLAGLLDSQVAIAQWPAASARRIEVMAALRKGGNKDRGKLAAARDMIG